MYRYTFSKKMLIVLFFPQLILGSCTNSTLDLKMENSSQDLTIAEKPNSNTKKNKTCLIASLAGVGGLIVGGLAAGLGAGLPLSSQLNSTQTQLNNQVQLGNTVMPFTTQLLEDYSVMINNVSVSSSTSLSALASATSVSIEVNPATSNALSYAEELFASVNTFTLNSTFQNKTFCNNEVINIPSFPSLQTLNLEGYFYQNISIPNNIQALNLNSVNKCFSSLSISCIPSACSNTNVANTIAAYNAQPSNLTNCYSSLIPNYFTPGSNAWPNGTVVSDGSLLWLQGLSTYSPVFAAIEAGEFSDVNYIFFYVQNTPSITLPPNINNICILNSLLLGNLAITAENITLSCIPENMGAFGSYYFFYSSIFNNNSHILLPSTSSVSMSGFSTAAMWSIGGPGTYGISCVNNTLQPASCTSMVSNYINPFNAGVINLYTDQTISMDSCL